MSRKILLLFAHPRYEKSTANRGLIPHIRELEFVTFRDLYEIYPDFNIHVAQEQRLLEEHDVLVWHHPFYWYSCPPLLKQWIDLVLTYGWAYGKGGDKLSNKMVFNTITTGGKRSAYQPDGHNRFKIKELLSPFDQTANLCKMRYLPPFVVHGTHHMVHDELNTYADAYVKMLEGIARGTISEPDVQGLDYLNDLIIKLS